MFEHNSLICGVADKTNKDNFLFKQFPITFSRHIQIPSGNGVYVLCPFDGYSHDCNICDKVPYKR